MREKWRKKRMRRLMRKRKKMREAKIIYSNQLELVEDKMNEDLDIYISNSDAEYDNLIKKLEEQENEMEKINKEEIEEYKTNFEQSYNQLKPKPSKDSLNWMKIRECAMRQNIFNKAQEADKEIEILQKKDSIKFNEDKEKKLNIELNKIKHRQDLEKNVFEMKKNAIITEFTENKKKEIEKIKKKYESKISELKNYQNFEISNFDKITKGVIKPCARIQSIVSSATGFREDEEEKKSEEKDKENAGKEENKENKDDNNNNKEEEKDANEQKGENEDENEDDELEENEIEEEDDNEGKYNVLYFSKESLEKGYKLLSELAKLTERINEINLNEKEEENIEIKNIINEEKVDSEKETEENDIGEESQSPEKAKEEIQKESISGVNPVNKKRRKKKKNRKKNYKLTEEELNNIHSNFYNDNNNFMNQNQKPKINTIIVNQQSEKSVYLHNLIVSFEKKITKKISSLHEVNYNSILFLCQIKIMKKRNRMMKN